MAEKKTLERVYTIPLRKEYQKAPHYKRAKRAISAIYDFVQRHVKTNDIKIGKFLNLKIHHFIRDQLMQQQSFMPIG